MEHHGKAGNRPLTLTLGEPAGIGPDITLLAWLRRDELKLPPFYLLGDVAFIARRAKALGLEVSVAEVGAEKTEIFSTDGTWCVELKNPAPSKS